MGTNKTRVKGQKIKKLPVGRKVATLLFLDFEPEAEKTATSRVADAANSLTHIQKESILASIKHLSP